MFPKKLPSLILFCLADTFVTGNCYTFFVLLLLWATDQHLIFVNLILMKSIFFSFVWFKNACVFMPIGFEDLLSVKRSYCI